MIDPTEQFLTALRARSIVPPDKLIGGCIARADVDGKHGKGDASYIVFMNGVPAGGFENHKDGLGWQTWRANVGRDLTVDEKTAQRKHVADAKHERDTDDVRRRADARIQATRIWETAQPADDDHPYILKKGIRQHGVRQSDDRLVVPVRDTEGVLHSVQFIGPDGDKRFLTGGRVKGCYLAIGKPDSVLCIAEGFATGASVHEATGHAVAVAFDCGNLELVAKALRRKYPDLRIIVCADNDIGTAGNPGIANATKAALAVGGYLAVPDFGEDRLESATDFNDLHQRRGADAVVAAVTNAKAPESGERRTRRESGEVMLRRVADVEAMPINWLWPGRIARGKLTMIAGHPGLGKSQITIALAAVVTTGARWPVDRSPCELGNVAMLSAEDDVADTIRPRLEAAGADVNRVEIIDGVVDAFDVDGNPISRALNLKMDIAKLDALFASRPDLALLIVDPVTAYLGSTDSHVTADVRALLAPLAALAAKYGIAVVLVSHLNKGGANAEALMRVTGSMAFVAAARGAFIVAKDPDNPARRLFLPAKNNIGPDIGGVAFGVEPFTLPSGIETSRILWEADPVTITADEAMAPAPEDGDRTMTDDATDLLRDVLIVGRVMARDIKRRAAEAGISDKALRNARQRLGLAVR